MLKMNDTPDDVDYLLRLHASQMPDAIVVRIGDETMSWGSFDAHVNQIANALIRRGIRHGDRVAALGRNSLNYILLTFGCLRAGGCIVPLQTLSSADAIIDMVNDSGAKLLFTSDEYVAGLATRQSELTEIDEDGFFSMERVCNFATSFSTLLVGMEQSAPPEVLDTELGACLIYSSGTTGVPKGILQSRAHKAHECRDLSEAGLNSTSETLISTPLCSSTSLFIMMAALGNGGTITVMEKFDAAEYPRLVERDRTTHALLVPVQFDRILNSEAFGKYDLSSFQVKVSIGAPLSKARKTEILERWPEGGLLEFYGMTEGGASCVLFAHERPDKLDTVGQPAENCDLKIIGKDDVPLGIGETGEIVGRSARMMKSYWNRPKETEATAWYDESGHRYQRSGDLGWLDEDGFLHLAGREKDMIISGGFNIYASDIEDVIAQHEHIVEVAVVGEPSEKWGESPVAFVVQNATANSTPQQIVEWTNQRLGKIQRLSNVYFIDELPRNPIGKVLKRELRNRLPRR